MGKRLKKSKQYLNSDIGSGGIHSQAYHKFFEGYSEYYALNSSGKRTVLRRVYTGVTYRCELSKKQFIFSKFLYCLLCIVSATLFVKATLQGGNAGSNTVWYTVLPQAVTTFLFIWFLCNLFCYLTNSRVMTIHEYNTSSRGIIRTSMFIACGMMVSAITTCIYLLLHLSEFKVETIIIIIKMVLSSFVFGGIHIIEKNVKYIRSENETDIAGATKI